MAAVSSGAGAIGTTSMGTSSAAATGPCSTGLASVQSPGQQGVTNEGLLRYGRGVGAQGGRPCFEYGLEVVADDFRIVQVHGAESARKVPIESRRQITARSLHILEIASLELFDLGKYDHSCNPQA